MNICGIDYSSHAIDIVQIPLDADAPPRWDRFDLEGQDAFQRARDVPVTMPRAHSAYWDDIVACGIEHPAGKHGTGALLRIQGAVLACLPPRLLVQPWPPASWRKAVGLKGNASKDDVGHHSSWMHYKNVVTPETPWISHIVFSDWPQDAHDAHLIAQATRQALQQQEVTPA